jgi:hypothetical protein
VNEHVRVAFVTTTTDQHERSWHARRLRTVAERLATRGHDVIVCFVQWWDGDHAAFEFGGVTYRRVTTGHAPRRFVTKLPLVLGGVGPDVIHALTRPPLSVPAARVAGRLRWTPVVAEWWDRPDRQGTTWRRRLAVRSADVVVVPSRTVATAVRACGSTPNAVEVLPDSVDMAGIRAAPK